MIFQKLLGNKMCLVLMGACSKIFRQRCAKLSEKINFESLSGSTHWVGQYCTTSQQDKVVRNTTCTIFLKGSYSCTWPSSHTPFVFLATSRKFPTSVPKSTVRISTLFLRARTSSWTPFLRVCMSSWTPFLRVHMSSCTPFFRLLISFCRASVHQQDDIKLSIFQVLLSAFWLVRKHARQHKV